MKTLNNIKAEIKLEQTLVKKHENKVQWVISHYKLYCPNCSKKEQDWFCSDSQWPLCFKPSEEWKEQHKNISLEDNL